MKTGAAKKLNRILQLILLLVLCTPCRGLLMADTFTEHRTLVGLKLFRTLVAADLNIEDKLNQQGELTVALLYINNNKEASDYRQALDGQFTQVKGHQVQTRLLQLSELNKTETMPLSAIFIAQPLNKNELTGVIQFAIQNHLVLFSPYEGDVEQGVLGGLSVQATVRPLINIKTLQQSKLNIKPFYLKVAKHYE